MKKLTGISAYPGIVTGVACLYSSAGDAKTQHYSIEAEQVPEEIKRSELAFKFALNTIEELASMSKELFGRQGMDIVNAHKAICNDRGLRNKVDLFIQTELVNAEHAISDVFDEYIERIRKNGGHFSELTHDIVDVKERVIESFSGHSGEFCCSVGKMKPVVVAAQMLTPSMVLNIPGENVLAFVSNSGGYTSHATILARTLNVPIIFGIDVEKEISCNQSVIIDGYLGKVIVDPDSEMIELYEKKR